MKLRLMICAMAASTVLFATDPVSDTFGVMAVTDNTSSNTVVGVPWVNFGEGSVTLSNLVSTATLTTGDVVYLYEGGTWFGYTLNSGIWEPMQTIGGTDSVGNPGPANAKTLDRGKGLIIQRASTNDAIYLCGRYDSTAPSATSVDAGATALIANPLTTTKTIGDGIGSNGDEIRIPLNGGGLMIYTKKDGVWGYYAETTTTRAGRTKTVRTWTQGCALSAGTGAWYVNNGNAQSEIAW